MASWPRQGGKQAAAGGGRSNRPGPLRGSLRSEEPPHVPGFLLDAGTQPTATFRGILGELLHLDLDVGLQRRQPAQQTPSPDAPNRGMDPLRRIPSALRLGCAARVISPHRACIPRRTKVAEQENSGEFLTSGFPDDLHPPDGKSRQCSLRLISCASPSFSIMKSILESEGLSRRKC